MSCRVAIIGGGPGGLMTAYQLQQRCTVPFEATLYEASGRLGGKVLTPRFASANVTYEAGAAELYDYSHVGEDPLRDLVERLGLKTRPMSGSSILLKDQVLGDLEDVGRIHGEATQHALAEFDLRAKRWMNPEEFYESDWRESNADPKAHRTFEEELAEVPDATARRFLRTMVHSDLATEPHQTSASYGLQNYLMNDSAYMTLYSIEGGVERLTWELAARVNASVRLSEPVERVERAGGRLHVFSRHSLDARGITKVEEYDFVAVALPNYFLPAIEWAGESLSDAMHRHHLHYDYPAHYLRISVLFREVFWKQHLKDSYFMLDAFGGCCLYDESSRGGCGDHGVLGWLLAGDAAMTASNHTDDELIAMMLDALPSAMQQGRDMFVEGRVHRWIGAVNGLPGGRPALDMESRHIPELTKPNLFVVGDYLFDSTLNGVFDSADYVAESIAEEMSTRAYSPAALHSAVI
jgi:protoporphyrinogen oxidase